MAGPNPAMTTGAAETQSKHLLRTGPYVAREPLRGADSLAHPLLRDDARFAVAVQIQLAVIEGHALEDLQSSAREVKS
jgi:hypothetical protein